MYWERTAIAIAFLCLLASAWTSPALGQSKPEKSVAALRQEVLDAKDRREAYDAWKALLQRVGTAGLPELMKDKYTSIALQAAWEAHKKPIKRPKPILDREDEFFDRDELKKFVAFLTERTKAPIPDWWAQQIVDVDLVDGGRWGPFHVFPATKAGSGVPGPSVRKSKLGNFVPQGAELHKDGERLVYTAGGKLVAFDPEDVRFFVRESDRFAALLGAKRSIIACYDDSGIGFRLVAFAGGSGRRIWQSTVWALDDGDVPTMPGGINRVELQEQRGVVYVIGVSWGGLYLEAFDSETGKCHFRFSTARWGKHWDPHF